MKRYSVLVVGIGKRGMHHAGAFNANPNFQVTAICDIDQKRLADAAGKLGNPRIGSDAAALAKEVQPDVFCFCTMPYLRTDFIKAGIDGGAKLIAFEKPVALTSGELLNIQNLLSGAGVKAVVSHQHRYGCHYRKVKEIIESGGLGRVHTVYGSATGLALLQTIPDRERTPHITKNNYFHAFCIIQWHFSGKMIGMIQMRGTCNHDIIACY